MHIGPPANAAAYHIESFLLGQSRSERDLGVIVADSLKTREHTDKVCASARGIIGAIHRSFTRLSVEAFKILFATHVEWWHTQVPKQSWNNSSGYSVGQHVMWRVFEGWTAKIG